MSSPASLRDAADVFGNASTIKGNEASIGLACSLSHPSPGNCCECLIEVNSALLPRLPRLGLRGVHDGLGALGHDDSLELCTVARFPGSKREPSEQKAVPVKVSTGSICALLTLKRGGDALRLRKAGRENIAYDKGLNWWATIECAR